MAYKPQQGDIIKLDFSPTKGHEQYGHRRAVVVSNSTFNNFARGIAIVCPTTNTDKNIPLHIKLDDRTQTTGVVLTDQVKALDLVARNAKYVEKIPNDLLYEICDIIGGFTEIEETKLPDEEPDEEETKTTNTDEETINNDTNDQIINPDTDEEK